MNEFPLISVIVPVYNGERFVGEALESVFRQRYDPLEVIVVDDGSTDGTAEVVKGFGSRVTRLHQPNAGPAAARNLGLAKAEGELIAFLDADDLWPEGKLAFQLEHLRSEPDAGLSMGYCRVEKLQGVEGNESTRTNWPHGSEGCHMLVGAMLTRRAVWETVGGFNAALRYGEDVDWFLRARECGVSFAVSCGIALIHRRHEKNMTLRSEAGKYELTYLFKLSMDRRRQAERTTPFQAIKADKTVEKYLESKLDGIPLSERG